MIPNFPPNTCLQQLISPSGHTANLCRKTKWMKISITEMVYNFYTNTEYCALCPVLESLLVFLVLLVRWFTNITNMKALCI